MVTIQFAELQRLAFANSPKLPQVIKIWDVGQKRGKHKRAARWIYKEWVGIGWIEVNEKPGAIEVVET
jgi:hypothetical protein